MPNDPYAPSTTADEYAAIEQAAPVKGMLAGLFVALTGFELILHLPFIYVVLLSYGFDDLRSWVWEVERTVDSTSFTIAKIACVLASSLLPAFFGGRTFTRLNRRQGSKLGFLFAGILAMAVHLIQGSHVFMLGYGFFYDRQATLVLWLVTILSVVGSLLGARPWRRHAK